MIVLKLRCFRSEPVRCEPHSLKSSGANGRRSRLLDMKHSSVFSLSRFHWANDLRWHCIRSLGALSLMSLTLAGCSTGGDVVAADKPDTYLVSASTTGGRLAWASAHERAIAQAEAYCKQRGMRASPEIERTSGMTMLETHTSQIRFECYPSL